MALLKDKRDLSHVLFALRFLQSQMEADAEVGEMLAESELISGEGISPTTSEEIDDLCERLNCDDPV